MTEFEKLQTSKKEVGIRLSALQEQMLVWQAHNFPFREPHIPLLGAGEELGELNHSFIKLQQNIRTEEKHEENMKDAVGDLIIFLGDFCNAQNIDMQAALDDTWHKVKQRDWKADKKKGGEG